MISDRIRRCLEPGLSILVGSADARGVPVCCRGTTLTSDDDLATVTVYVPLATSQETIANVASTRRIAVAATHAIDHCSTQLKGVTTSVRLAREDEKELVTSGVDRFGDILNEIGVPKRLMRTLTPWPAFAIEVRVEEIYDQTPGPNAGVRLR
jgi:hypothetical protein